jgi:hypothetical protein
MIQCVQKSDKPNTKEDNAAEVSQASICENVATSIVFSIPPGVRIMKVIIWLRMIGRKV